jgi:hypothetical protein
MFPRAVAWNMSTTGAGGAGAGGIGAREDVQEVRRSRGRLASRLESGRGSS